MLAGQRVDGHLTLSATWRSSCSSLTLTCSSRQHMQCQVARQRKSTCCRQSCTQSKRPRSHHDTLVSALEVHGHLHGIAHEALVQAVQLVLVPGAHSENSWSERVSSAAQQLNSLHHLYHVARVICAGQECLHFADLRANLRGGSGEN